MGLADDACRDLTDHGTIFGLENRRKASKFYEMTITYQYHLLAIFLKEPLCTGSQYCIEHS
jgi:hypothetical protein